MVAINNSNLNDIITKPAGTYFIVNDRFGNYMSTVSNLRVLFINSKKGPVNNLILFDRYDTDKFISIFGNTSYKEEKNGNFSIRCALEMLEAGPLGIINLRSFEDIDTIGCYGINPNIQLPESSEIKYTDVFNTNNFWTIKPSNINQNMKQKHIINIANVGNKDLSVFILVSDNYKNITDEGYISLKDCTYEIDDFNGLNFDMLLKDTIVDVYIFENTFDSTSYTNTYYGKLFDEEGNINSYDDLLKLTTIKQSGFKKIITGSLIPEIEISLDTLLNTYYQELGLICFIDDEIFESKSNFNLIDFDLSDYYDSKGNLKPNINIHLLSHKIKDTLRLRTVYYPPQYTFDLGIDDSNYDVITHQCVGISPTSFECADDQGIKLGDKFIGKDGSPVYVTGIEIISTNNEVTLRTFTREFDKTFS